ncbi:MAG: endolytic transglycosylase MltG [Actinomycetota bacterium]
MSSIAIGTVIFVAAGLFLLNRGPSTPSNFETGSAGKEISISIPNGATGSDIALLLFKKGVVASSLAFFNAAVVDPKSSTIAPGVHRIALHIPAEEALAQLLDTKRIENLIKVPEGVWTTELLTLMQAEGFSRPELESALKKITAPKGFTGTEGIFFPAQYSFAKGTSALTALQNMVNRFGDEAKNAGLSAGSKEFSSMQLLTIASLVQAEGDESDFAKISQVVRNRLKIGMPLQFDSTIHYIRKTRGQVYLSSDATKISSDYNTYLHYGLPPGPINSPGKLAIKAAMNPEPGPWLYFITVKPRDTRFTDSDAEFLRWKSEYEANLRAGAFGSKS